MAALNRSSCASAAAHSSSSSSRRRRGGSRGVVVVLWALGLLGVLTLSAAQQQQQEKGSSSSSSSDAGGSSSVLLQQGLASPSPTSPVSQAAAAAASPSPTSLYPPPSADADDCSGGGLSLGCLRSGVWLSSGTQAAEAAWFVIFIASPFALISIVLLTLGVVDLRYSTLSCSYLPTWTLPLSQALLAAFWTLLIPLAAYLVSRNILPMIVFLVFSCLAAVAHWVLLGGYVQRAARNRALEQPRQQLLTARDKADPKRGVDEEAPNPFNAPSLGVIPGTSNMGYILWLPPEDSSSSSHPPPAAHGYQAAPSPTQLAGRPSLEGRARLMPKTVQQS